MPGLGGRRHGDVRVVPAHRSRPRGRGRRHDHSPLARRVRQRGRSPRVDVRSNLDGRCRRRRRDRTALRRPVVGCHRHRRGCGGRGALDRDAVGHQVQPALDPTAYFKETERRSRRASLGAAQSSGWAFGYPIPPALRDPDAAARVSDALGSFAGKGGVVRYRKPVGAASPDGFDTVTIRGHWGRASRDDRQQLRRGVTRWLVRSLGSHA